MAMDSGEFFREDGIFNIGWNYEIDAKYGTDYKAWSNGVTNYFEYKFMVEMFGYASITWEFFEWYWQENRGHLQFFDVRPLIWQQTRPADYSGQYCINFNYDIQFL